jgi:hypothetical protein
LAADLVSDVVADGGVGQLSAMFVDETFPDLPSGDRGFAGREVVDDGRVGVPTSIRAK